MRSRCIAFCVCALVAMAPSEARADWIVRPFFGAALNTAHGFVDLEQSNGSTKLVIGAAAAWNRRTIGFEFEVGSLPGFFEGPEHLITAGNLTTIMGNVAWQLPKPNESSRVRAYVAGGLGVVRVRLEDALGAYTTSSSLAAANVGGGILVRLQPRVDLNIDARYFKTQYDDPGRAGFTEQFVSFTRLTGGVLLRF